MEETDTSRIMDETEIHNQNLIDLHLMTDDQDALLELFEINQGMAYAAYYKYGGKYILDSKDEILSLFWELLSSNLPLYVKLREEKDRMLSTWVIGSLRKRISRYQETSNLVYGAKGLVLDAEGKQTTNTPYVSLETLDFLD